MEHIFWNEKETLCLDRGRVFVKGRLTGGRDLKRRTLVSMVQAAFAAHAGDHPECVRLKVGSGFSWDVEAEQIQGFDEILLDMMDEVDWPWNVKGELEARVQVIAIT